MVMGSPVLGTFRVWGVIGPVLKLFLNCCHIALCRFSRVPGDEAHRGFFGRGGRGAASGPGGDGNHPVAIRPDV